VRRRKLALLVRVPSAAPAHQPFGHATRRIVEHRGQREVRATARRIGHHEDGGGAAGTTFLPMPLLDDADHLFAR
jgi:hypothetical protein